MTPPPSTQVATRGYHTTMEAGEGPKLALLAFTTASLTHSFDESETDYSETWTRETETTICETRQQECQRLPKSQAWTTNLC